MNEFQLDLYFDDLKITVFSDNETLLTNIKRDLGYFTAEKSTVKNIRINAFLKEPDYKVIDRPFLFHHFDGADCYGFGDIRYAKYDKSLLIFDAKKDEGFVISSNSGLLHQYTYYMILSKSGEYFDLKNAHRLHSLGISYKGKAMAFMMNRAGGKTTLALEFMKDDNVKLFSEDTPLITSKLNIKPFPTRLAIRLDNETQFPQQYTRVIKEPFFGHKKLLDLEFFGDGKIEDEKPLDYLFLSQRLDIEKPYIKKLNKINLFFILLDRFVKGKQFPQRAELLFRISPSGLKMLLKLAINRFLTSIKIVSKIKSYIFYMSNNPQSNVDCIKEFINNKL